MNMEGFIACGILITKSMFHVKHCIDYKEITEVLNYIGDKYYEKKAWML